MRRPLQMYENLFSVLRKNFPSDDTTFIRTASGRVISYGDMLKRTAQFANALVELGVKPGDRVPPRWERVAKL